MTFEIILVLSLLVIAMILFATEWFSIDVVTLGLLVILVISGVLSPAEAFQGFGSEVIIILASIMALAGAIVKAGVMDWPGQLAHRLSGERESIALLVLMSLSAGSSAFVSNTNATAVLTPAGMEAARRAKISPSRVLMPIAYASILGGSCTLIGTSTNLAGSAMATRLGLEPYGLFEFTAIGAIIAIVGIFWLAMIGHRLVPQRRPAEENDVSGRRGFCTSLFVPARSSVIGKSIGEVDFEDLDVTPLLVLRGVDRLTPHAAVKLAANDLVLVKASRDAILRLNESSRFPLEPNVRFAQRFPEDAVFTLAEALVIPQSRLAGETLEQASYFERFKGFALAIYRRDGARPQPIEDVELKVGDVLLLQGQEDHFAGLKAGTDLRVLTEISDTIVTERQGFLALGALLGAVLAGATGILPFSVAMLVALLFVVITGCISMQEAYRFMEWRLLVLIAGMTSFGLAMETSGTAEFLAGYIVSISLPFGPIAAMGAFAVMTVALTQPMSNAAAALTVMPIAVAASSGLGIEPRTLAILVTLSASFSFITPLEPASLLVYGPGRYKFFDFVRAGTPLTIITLVLLLVLVPVFWP